MPEENTNSTGDQPDSFGDLKERNRVLEEQLSAQQDMLARTTAYLEELQEELRKSNEQLEDYNQNLEAKVQARTHELEEKNKELAYENQQKAAYQKRLEQSNHELNTLMYRASHDLRGPITNALGLLTLLSDEDDGTATYLRSTLNEMLTIVDSLHNLIYYQNLEETPIALNIANTLEAAFQKGKDDLGINNVQLDILFDKDSEINAYPDAFHLLFYQLFKNSLQFARQEIMPYIEVDFEESEAYWYFYVSDTSTGIDSGITESIFEMFTKGEGNSGIGLGLFQAHTLAEKMEGTVQLAKNTDKGTTFAVKICKSLA